MTTPLAAFLTRIGQEFTGNFAEIRDIQDWMLDEVYRKRVAYTYWKKKALFSWVSFRKIYPEPQYHAKFLYKKFDSLFRYFIEKMFPFQERNLEFLGAVGDVEGNTDIFYEYRYLLSSQDLQDILELKEKFHHPEHHYRIISYLFNLVTMIFGRMLKEIIKIDIQIIMLCADLDTEPNGDKKIHFLIVSREQDKAFLRAYLRSMIFQFAEVLPSIDQDFLERLRIQHNFIYSMAMQQYKKGASHLQTVLFTLERKAMILQQCTPLLDILNYICSRVEDSVYTTTDLVKDIIQTKFSTSEHNVQDLLEIFNFFNQNASLFSTFQANNRANIQRQYQLFFFYNQYFCAGGLEIMESNPAFFFPEIIRNAIRKENFARTFPNISFMSFSHFISKGMSIVGNPALDIVFTKIFRKRIFEMNESFIETFLFSLNQKFNDLIEEKRKKNPEFHYTFNEIIHFLVVTCNNLAIKIFIAGTPMEAQNNFRDYLTRYTPEKIALRLLELKIFKDIPLSDNNWQDYYLSRNKSIVKKIFQQYYDIPDGYFFSPERLLRINMIYERRLLDETPPIETWVIETVLKNFYQFQDNIKKHLPDIFTDKDLVNALTDEFSRGVIDPAMREHIEELAELLAETWKT